MVSILPKARTHPLPPMGRGHSREVLIGLSAFKKVVSDSPGRVDFAMQASEFCS